MAENRLKAFGQKPSQIGRRMLLVSGAMAGPLAFAARTFAGFEDQMLAVKAVTRAVGDQFYRLYDQAKRLGRTTSFTASEVAGGMLSLGRAGFKPAEIEEAIPGVLNLARATGTDLAQSADIAAGTLRAFALEAQQMGRVTDVLVATANNSAQTFEDLGESMKYVAPIAEEYGLSLEQTTKAVGALANMQIKGSRAGTSMRQIMLRLADPAIQKQLRANGVEALDAAKNLRPVGDILVDLGRAIPAYINTLCGLRGKVNDSAWRIFARGEVRLVSISGTARGEWTVPISFGFEASHNVTGLQVGDITGIAKEGWHYLWTLYEDAEDTTAQALVKNPKAAYVEQVYEYGDFSALGLSDPWS